VGLGRSLCPAVSVHIRLYSAAAWSGYTILCFSNDRTCCSGLELVPTTMSGGMLLVLTVCLKKSALLGIRPPPLLLYVLVDLFVLIPVLYHCLSSVCLKRL
jgi:hypothetical protein